MCIAEKPSVAKEIAQIIGATKRNNGYYEGNGYQVTWTFGHLCTLKEPKDYHQSLKAWNMATLPIVPPRFGIKLIKNSGVKEQFEVIKKLVGAADQIINCGDAGQEGELIQRWVLTHAKNTKPIQRLWISSLTEEAIREGFLKLKDSALYDKLYYAGSSRAIGDWLLGINATRLYTMKYAPRGTVLSIGRVQTPTLAMIVSRFLEIENFVSTDFWELKTTYRQVVFNSDQGKIEDEQKAHELLEKLKNKELEILDYQQKEGKEAAPKLFDLTSLQVECNKKLNLSAEDTLKIAQKLYEKKYLTYPRVDTRFLPDDIYPKVAGILKSMTGYSELIAPLLGKPIRKSKAVFNTKKVTDHHAIIPTHVTAIGLYGDEQDVYEMVAKRFIANFYPDCIVSKTTVKALVDQVNFKATGKQIVSTGWRVVYGQEEVEDEEDKNPKDESSQLLPLFEVGEKGAQEAFTEKKQTSPPKLYTEATLLRAMETAGKTVDDEKLREAMKENGIGRPSTRANIIETLFKRKYIERQRKNIVPTTIGQQLIGTIKSDLLKSPELTGNWEKKLRDIENGSYDVKVFLEEMKQFVAEVVFEVKKDHYSSRIVVEQEDTKKPNSTPPNSQANPPDAKALTCPKCKKGQILTGTSAYGCSGYKTGCEFRIPMEMGGKKLTSTHLSDLVSKQKTKLIKGLLIGGAKKNGSLLLTKEFNIEFKEKAPTPWHCPVCQKGTVVKGNKAYGCNRYSEGCHFVIPFLYYQKKLTQKQVESLVLKGRTPLIKGFKNEAGRIADGRIVIGKDNKIEIVIEKKH